MCFKSLVRENKDLFINFNNFISQFKSKLLPSKPKEKSPRRGQVAIILLLLTVIALVFYAVTLNLTRTNDTKTIVTVASNSGASLLASQMASYGQMIFKTTMGGERKICALSGVATALILVIVIVIAIIIIVTTAGAAAAPVAAAISLVIGGVTATMVIVAVLIAAAFALASLALQLAYVEPKLTSSWNKNQSVSLSTVNQFLEHGIQTGLQSSVGDRHRVPDFDDADQDGLFGYDTRTREPKDTIGRFAYYYTQRLKNAVAPDATKAAMEDFVNALKDLVYSVPSPDPLHHWGLFDPAISDNPNIPPSDTCKYDRTTNPNVPSECNRCCLPATINLDTPQYNPETGENDLSQKDIRNKCCDCNITFYNGNKDADGNPKPDCEQGEQCGTATTCMLPTSTGYTDPVNSGFNVAPNVGNAFKISPFSEKNLTTNTTFRFAFNFLFENRDNNDLADGVSFREAIGQDDENMYYGRDSTNINYYAQTPLSLTESKFKIEDTTGYLPQDQRPGIFSYFYKMQDWALDLKTLDPANKHIQCFWCDPRGPECSSVGLSELPPTSETSQLKLPYDPSALTMSNTAPGGGGNNSGWCVDKQNIGANPPLVLDLIPSIFNLEVPTGSCVQVGQGFNEDALGYPATNDTSVGIWKRGRNNYCGVGDDQPSVNSTLPLEEWPYYTKCLKDINNVSNDETCKNSNNNPSTIVGEDKNTYDILDSMSHNLEQFLIDMEKFLAIDSSSLSGEFTQVYDQIAKWIEGPIPDGTLIAPGCYTDASGKCLAGQTIAQVVDSDTSESSPDPDNLDAPDPSDPADQEAAQISQDKIPVGFLPKFSKQLELLIQRLKAWEVNDTDLSTPGVQGAGYFSECTGDNGAWCIPKEDNTTACYASMPASEKNFIYQDHNGDGVKGDVSDVIACMDYHINGLSAPNTLNPPNVEQGDYLKFNNCYRTCIPGVCSSLPRSLLASYDPTLYSKQTPMPSATDAFDIATFRICLDTCNQQNCTPKSQGGTLFDKQTSTGIPYNYTIAPSPWDPNRCTNWAQGNPYWDMINGLYKQSGGQYCDMSSSGVWLAQTHQAAMEAQQQMEKLKLRRDFLKKRYDEVEKMIGTLQNAHDKIEGFLSCKDANGDGKIDGAACRLVQYRTAYDSTKPSGLPYQAIYGWKDDDSDGVVGRWHAVRIDARIPGRCDKGCGVKTIAGVRQNFIGTKEKKFPWVRTYNAGLKRCYALTDTDGFIKFRVTRYDEPPQSAKMLFPNGRPIWDFRSFSPNKSSFDTTNIQADGICGKLMARNTVGTPLTSATKDASYYKNAFILNERKNEGANSADNPGNNIRCWDTMTKFLAKGVSSETCAAYYYKEGDRKGFTFRFVDCRQVVPF
jgi:hypothetical protein